MATKKTNKANERKLVIFFNKEARKSAADSLKKASWLMAAGAAALGYTKGSVTYVVVVVVGWIVAQILATIILSIEERNGNGGSEPAAEKEKENDGKRPAVARKRPER